MLVGASSLMFYAAAITMAQSGDNNQLFLLQESPSGSLTGNTLTVDQSEATGSLVSGLLDSGHPAIQRGSGNELEIEISGAGGSVRLLQDNSGSAGGNSADIFVQQSAAASLSQIGDGNSASLNVNGLLAEGAVVQDGLNNDANLTVVGNGASGEITQDGDENNAGLSVTGAGTSVSFTQAGNSMSYTSSYDVNSSPGVQVISNGATVTITQTTF